jgi:pentatricopeptide repeat protein
MKEKNIITYNAMIEGYASFGKGNEGIELFEEMKKKGIKPDEITFTSLLNGLSHIGEVNKAIEIYYSIEKEYQIKPNLQIQNCIIDAFARNNQFEEAEKFIEKEIKNPNIITYISLLGGCRKFRNAELSQKYFEKAIELDKNDDSIYVLTGNIFSLTNNGKDEKKIRNLMDENKIKKIPRNKLDSFKWKKRRILC